MKKLVIMAAAGLVVGLGGGGYAGGLKAKGRILEARAQAEADSVAAGLKPAPGEEHDAHDVTPGGDGGEEAHGAGGSEDAGAADSVVAEELPPGEAAVHGADAAEPPAPAARPSSAPTQAAPAREEEVLLNVEGARKLAKIFGAMKPADAAAVLAEMSDEEVKAVLLQLNDRQAAPILGSFPAERAATLSRVVLRDRGGL